MDKYRKVAKQASQEPIMENEIRITTQGQIRNYINYATSLLQEKQMNEIVLKAMGQAISKTVVVTEMLKNRIPGLHQENSISSTIITDVWEPIEEGLLPVEKTRRVSLITVTLSTVGLNKNSPGYQAPKVRLPILVERPSRHQQPRQQLQPQQRRQQPRYKQEEQQQHSQQHRQQQQQHLRQRQLYSQQSEQANVPAPVTNRNQESYGGRIQSRGGGRGRGQGWTRGGGGYGSYQGRGEGRGRGYGRVEGGVGGYQAE